MNQFFKLSFFLGLISLALAGQSKFEFKRVVDINIINYDGAGLDKSQLLLKPIILNLNADTNKYSIAVSGYLPHTVEKECFESFRNTVENFPGQDMKQDLTISLTGTNIHCRKKRIQFQAQIEAVGLLELKRLFKKIDGINALRQKTKQHNSENISQQHLQCKRNMDGIDVAFGEAFDANCDALESTESSKSDLEGSEALSPVPFSTESGSVVEPSSSVSSRTKSERVIDLPSPVSSPKMRNRVLKPPLSPVSLSTGSESVTISSLPPNTSSSATPPRLMSRSMIYPEIPHTPQLYKIINHPNHLQEENHTISMYKLNVNRNQKQCPIFEKYWGPNSRWREYGQRKITTIITPAPKNPTPIHATQAVQSTRHVPQNMKVKKFGEHFYVQKTPGMPFSQLNDGIHGGKQTWINGEQFFIDAAEWHDFLQTYQEKR